VNTPPCFTGLGESFTLAESAAAGGSGEGEGVGWAKGEGEGVGAAVGVGAGVGLAVGDGRAAVAVGAAVTVATGATAMLAGSPSLFWQARRARPAVRAARASIPLKLSISRRFYPKSTDDCTPHCVSRNARD
jgi:hypothetical protein